MGIKSVRGVAGAGLVITTVGVIYTVAAMAGWEPEWGSGAQAVLHLGELAVVLALAARIAGPLGRIGSVLAVLGQLLLAVAEVVFMSAPDVADLLFEFGPLLSGAGMICIGIVVLRTGALRWRLLPLLVGIWILVPATPVLIVTGGPPNPAALAVIAVWDVLWAATAASILAVTRSVTGVLTPDRAPA